MKSLEECKAYFMDAFMDFLTYEDEEEELKFNTLKEALSFIYGSQYREIENTWLQEGLNEFYS